MATKKITYAGKSNQNPVVDRTKQSTAEDWNEVKTVVNSLADSIDTNTVDIATNKDSIQKLEDRGTIVAFSSSVNVATQPTWDLYKGNTAVYTGATTGVFDLPSITNTWVNTGDGVTIKNSGTGSLYLRSRSGETIDGQSSIIIKQGDSITVNTDKIKWYIDSDHMNLRAPAPSITPAVSSIPGDVVYKGDYTVDANGLPSSAKEGWMYRILNTTTIGTSTINPGDFIIAVKDNPDRKTIGGNWVIVSGVNVVHSIAGRVGVITSDELKSILKGLGVRFVDEKTSFNIWYGMYDGSSLSESNLLGLTNQNTKRIYGTYTLTQADDNTARYIYFVVPENKASSVGHFKIAGGMASAASSFTQGTFTSDGVLYKWYRSPNSMYDTSINFVVEV